MHQKAIAVGSVEPKGNGATATVTKRTKDEIRFDGASAGVVMFLSSNFIGTLGRLAQQAYSLSLPGANRVVLMRN